MLTHIPQIRNIITTNYDLLFEKVYNEDLDVIIRDFDLPEVATSGKVKLYKIHGDLIEPETIIITKRDYIKFFEERQYEPLWTKIKSLIADYAILFIGYSFEDTNIKYIFDDILEKLKQSFNEGYLIAPDLPRHKQAYLLHNYSMNYINMTAEDAIKAIKDKIRKHLIEDCQRGYVNPILTNKILKMEGVKTEFSIVEDKIYLKFLGAYDKDLKLTGNISLKLPRGGSITDEYKDFIQGKQFGKFETILDKNEIHISSNIAGINIPFPQGFEQLKIKMESLPKKIFKSYLMLKKSNKTISDLKGKSYFSSRAFRIDLNHTAFDLTLNGDIKDFRKVAISLNFSRESNLIERKNVLEFFIDWFRGDTMLIYSELNDQPLPIDFRDIELPEEFIGKIEFFNSIYSNLVEIQKFFNLSFKSENLNEISNDDLKSINEILFAIEGRKQNIDEVTLKIELKNENAFQKLSNKEAFSLEAITPERKIVKLFDSEIDLGNCCIEGNDCYVDNYEQVKEEFNQGKRELRLVFKSKTNDLFILYIINKEEKGKGD
jgi:hypothetical protein